MDVVVAKMMNSTVGTPEYKPLDELILIGGKQLVASDYPFMTVSTPNVSSTGTTRDNNAPVVDICTIQPMVGGSVKISVNMAFHHGGATLSSVRTTGYLYVYVNDELKYTFTARSTEGEKYSSALVTGDISFDKNDKITFKLYATGDYYNGALSFYAAMQDILLKANISDTLIKVL